VEPTLTSAIERRRTARWRSVREHGIDAARLRRGVPVSIVDVSPGGVLIDTQQRLLPGMPLEIHFERHERISTVRGRVLRCSVFELSSSAVVYRGAIVFERHQPWRAGDLEAGSSFTTAEPRETARIG
jgi:PilZ domain-containing protein